MKKILFIIFYSLYLFITLGLFLHTSANPQVFGKYTIKYLIILILLILFSPAFLWVVNILVIPSEERAEESHAKDVKRKVFLLDLLSGMRSLHALRLVGMTNRATSKMLLKGIVYLSLIFLIIIMPVELFLRSKYKNFESTSYQYTIDNFDPFLQFKLTNIYTSNINSYGFRGEEISKRKPSGTYRIFILGGSSVLNRGIPFEKTAARILEKLLQKKYSDKKIEVINGGVDGYTTEHSLIQYLFKIKDFNPDLIIMWHGINDWYYSCSPDEHAYGNFKPDYTHFLGADGGMALTHFHPQPITSFKLLTFDFFIKFLQDNWYSDIKAFIKKQNPYQGIYTNKTKNMTYEMKDFPSLSSYKRNILSFIHATRDDNVMLILGNQPFLYNKHLSRQALASLFFPKLNCSKPDGKYPSLESMIRAMDTYNKSVEDLAGAAQVPFADLASQLPKSADYFTDDVHYTEKGNEKVGEALYQSLIENKIIK